MAIRVVTSIDGTISAADLADGMTLEARDVVTYDPVTKTSRVSGKDWYIVGIATVDRSLDKSAAVAGGLRVEVKLTAAQKKAIFADSGARDLLVDALKSALGV